MDAVLKHKNGNNTPSPRGADRAEYDRATKDLRFVKDFFPALEALYKDPLETAGGRFLAWVKRHSWGNYCLYAIDAETGEPKFQCDAERELGLSKQTISKVAKYWEQRGYIDRRGPAKLLYPVLDPAPTGPDPEIVKKSPEWATFLDLWKVAHSTDFSELEVARSTVERIRKVLRADYKKYRAAGTNGGASLYERKAEERENSSSSPEPAPPVAAAASPDDVEVVFTEISKRGQTTRKACGRLIAVCRAKRPNCSAEWLVALIRGINFANSNRPVGLIFSELPMRVVDNKPPPPPESDQQRKKREAAYVLEHPAEFDDESLEWARTTASAG